ncbi:hypothetical protein BUALT_Bualt02G0037500 [Buddleja alternifolia]|uniref:Uncharacterized protein n=1 Tax=Buddleja alternifolia TaxID=168488 RepID=A0AAV6XYL9_9LAMI|nr:hypothetical protein BUALT_Bualt02G0037500 [Buddleja alternifolia]
MDELRQSLLLSMELEDTRIKAQEDLKLKDEQISQLKHLLTTAIKERDEAQQNCQKLFLEKLIIQQKLQQNSANISSIDDDPTRGFSSSDCDESIVSSPQPAAAAELPVVVDRPLPEKGKLLEAVMKAGPLLQTLLLAGPLPQWRHPPPPLETYQIPPPPVAPPLPVNNCGSVNRKRGLCEGGSDSSVELKYQRIVLQ